MAESLTERDPVDIDELAVDFVERHRRGEFPSIEEYAADHPELADEIRDLFPTIAELEGFKQRVAQSGGVAAPRGTRAIERLADFRIIREIGRGGMGIVYEAEQESLGRRVAVKVLPRSSLLQPKQLARFQREARTAARLHHTHIVPVFGVGEDDGHHFIVMQLIPGVGLDDVLRELRRLESGIVEKAQSADFERPASHVARSLLSACSAEAAAATMDSETTQTDATSDASPSFGESKTVFQPTPPALADTNRTTRIEPGDTDTGDERFALKLSGEHLGAEYWRNIARIGRDAAEALEYAHHSGTLHRDVKPGNLLVDVQGAVWVADFGLAKATEGDQVSQTGDIVGTLRYMAPEQLRDAAEARSDVYGLGLTLYELATLRPAFDQQACRRAVMQNGDFGEPPRPRRLVEHIPRDLETIIQTAIAPEPERRYQTAGALAADLDRFLEDRPILARRARWYEHLWRWSRRNRSVAALSAVALLLLVAIAAVSTTGYYRTEKARKLAQDRLVDERAQRKRAEGTLTISLEALDAVYRGFAPDRMTATESLSLQDGEDEQTVSVQPVLAPEHAKFLEDILVYYDRLAKYSSGNVTLREEAAKANRRIGDIHQRLGNPDRAKSAFQRAAAMYTTLLAESTDESQQIRVELELARIDNHLGEVARAGQAHEESTAAFNSARKRLERLAADADAADVKFELARTYYLLAEHPQNVAGRVRGPREFRRDGGRQRRFGPGARLRGGRRDGGGRREGGGRRDGNRRRDGGRFGAKRPGERERGGLPDPFRGPAHNPQRDEYLNKAVAILESLHKSYPKVGDYQHWLAIVLRERGDQPHSSDYRRAVALLEDLSKRFPNQSDYHYALAETWSRGAHPHRHRFHSEAEEVETRLRKAHNVVTELTRRQSNIPAYSLLQASIAHRLTIALERRARKLEPKSAKRADLTAEITALHKIAVDQQAKLVNRYPEVVPYTIWLAKFRESRARHLIRTDRLTAARSTLEAAHNSVKRLPEEHPARRFLFAEQYFAFSELAAAYETAGDTEKRDAAIRSAIEVRNLVGQSRPRKSPAPRSQP